MILIFSLLHTCTYVYILILLGFFSFFSFLILCEFYWDSFSQNTYCHLVSFRVCDVIHAEKERINSGYFLHHGELKKKKENKEKKIFEAEGNSVSINLG